MRVPPSLAQSLDQVSRERRSTKLYTWQRVQSLSNALVAKRRWLVYYMLLIFWDISTAWLEMITVMNHSKWWESNSQTLDTIYSCENSWNIRKINTNPVSQFSSSGMILRMRIAYVLVNRNNNGNLWKKANRKLKKTDWIFSW